MLPALNPVNIAACPSYLIIVHPSHPDNIASRPSYLTWIIVRPGNPVNMLPALNPVNIAACPGYLIIVHSGHPDNIASRPSYQTGIIVRPGNTVNPILHTAWLDNHALTLKRNTAKYFFGEKFNFLHIYLPKTCCQSRKI
jgi:hypothetical protein